MKRALSLLLLLASCSRFEVPVGVAPPPPPPRAPKVPGATLLAVSQLQPVLDLWPVFDFGGDEAALLVSLGAGRDLELAKVPPEFRLTRVDASGAVTELPAPPLTAEGDVFPLPTVAPGRFAFLDVASSTAVVLVDGAWARVPAPVVPTLDTPGRKLTLFSGAAGAARDDAGRLLLWNGAVWTGLTLPAPPPFMLGPWSSDGKVRVLYTPTLDRVCTQLIEPATATPVGAEACLDTPAVEMLPAALNGTVDDFQFTVRTRQYVRAIHFAAGVFTVGDATEPMPDVPGCDRVALRVDEWFGEPEGLAIGTDVIHDDARRVATTGPQFSAPPGVTRAVALFNAQHVFLFRDLPIEGRTFFWAEVLPIPMRPQDFPKSKWPARCDTSPTTECVDGTLGCAFGCPELNFTGCVPNDAGVTCLPAKPSVEPLDGRGVRLSGRLEAVTGAPVTVRFEVRGDAGFATDLDAPPGFFSWNVTPGTSWDVVFEADAGDRFEPVVARFEAPTRAGDDRALAYALLSQGRLLGDASPDAGLPDVVPAPGANAALMRWDALWHVVKRGAAPHAVDVLGEFISTAQQPVVMPDGRAVLFPGNLNTSSLVDLTTGQLIAGVPGAVVATAVIPARSAPCALIGAMGTTNVWCWGTTLTATPPNLVAGATRINSGRATLTEDGVALVHFDDGLQAFERRVLATGDRETLPAPTHTSFYVQTRTVTAGSGWLVMYRAYESAQPQRVRLEAVWRGASTWSSAVVADGLLGADAKVVTALSQPVAGWLAEDAGGWSVMRFDGRTGAREVVAAAPGGAPLAGTQQVAGDFLLWQSAGGLQVWNVLDAAPTRFAGAWAEVRVAPNGDFAAATTCAEGSMCTVLVGRGGQVQQLTVQRDVDEVSLLGELDTLVALRRVQGAAEELRLQPCSTTPCRLVDGTAETVMRASRPPFFPIGFEPASQHGSMLGAWGLPCALYLREFAVPTVTDDPVGEPMRRGARCAR